MLAACLLAAAIAVHDLASLFIPDRYTPGILLVGFAVVARGGGFRRAGLAHRAGGALLFLVCLFDVAHRRLRGRAGFGDNKLIGVSAVLVGLAASAPRSYLPRSRLSSSASSAPCGSILNTAELIGALRAAGAAPGTAHDLASKISGHRAGPTPPNGQPTGSAPPKAENDTKLFQTVSESAAFPGITPAWPSPSNLTVTVSSGLASVRLEALDDGLESDIPGLPPSVRKAVKEFQRRSPAARATRPVAGGGDLQHAGAGTVLL